MLRNSDYVFSIFPLKFLCVFVELLLFRVFNMA
jgi:hypothetical protein